MPKIESWGNLPAGVRQHLVDRMRDRFISVVDLNRLRLWIETKPEVPATDWYKDFGAFKICGRPPNRHSAFWMAASKSFSVRLSLKRSTSLPARSKTSVTGYDSSLYFVAKASPPSPTM